MLLPPCCSHGRRGVRLRAEHVHPPYSDIGALPPALSGGCYPMLPTGCLCVCSAWPPIAGHPTSSHLLAWLCCCPPPVCLCCACCRGSHDAAQPEHGSRLWQHLCPRVTRPSACGPPKLCLPATHAAGWCPGAQRAPGGPASWRHERASAARPGRHVVWCGGRHAGGRGAGSGRQRRGSRGGRLWRRRPARHGLSGLSLCCCSLWRRSPVCNCSGGARAGGRAGGGGSGGRRRSLWQAQRGS